MKSPIQGSRFYRPAVALLTVLPANTPVSLLRDPDNEYDANAIKIMLDALPLNIDEEKLENALLETGYEIAALDFPIMLGHVARETAAVLAPKMDSGEEFTAHTIFLADGKNGVEID